MNDVHIMEREMFKTLITLSRVSARMAAAGCGPVPETDASAVLARLRSRQT